MGNCLTGQQVRSAKQFYHDDVQIQEKSQIYIPLTTTLFNTLRKTSDLVVLQPDIQTNCLFSNTLNIDFKTSTPNNLKLLLNFKKVVLVGSYTESKDNVIKIIKSNTVCSRFYVIDEVFCQSFLNQYPLFKKEKWEKDLLVTAKIPIFVMDSKQFYECTNQRLRLFIHSSTKKDMKIYNQIGVRQQGIIPQPPQGTEEQTNLYYLSALKKSKAANIMMLHPPKMNPSQIKHIVSTFISEKYQFPLVHANKYVQNSLPSVASSMRNDSVVEIAPPISKTAVLIISEKDKLKNLLQSLQGEAGIQKTQRAYGLLNTLITNIYSNPDNQDGYRKVKRTNKQINDLLAKYKNGKKLLNEFGFQQEDENWVNKLESKYLKIFKTDFDVAFKQYKNGITEVN